MISLVNKLKIQNSLIKSNSLCFLSQRSKYLIETDELYDLIQTEQKESSRNYHLNVKLPYPVKFTDGSAKFDKRKSTLIVTLPVCKPDDNPCLKQSMSIEENYDGHEASAISACNQHETANENDDDDHDNSECFHEDNSTLSIISDNSIVIVNRKKEK